VSFSAWTKATSLASEKSVGCRIRQPDVTLITLAILSREIGPDKPVPSPAPLARRRSMMR
jgi:hypothetical protein